jgi:hypothetical protein
MNAVLKVTFVLGSAAAAALTCAAQMPSGDGGVQEAIRFERAKDAADARQARIEAARPHSQVTQTKSATTANTVGDGGVQQAIRFERSKDAADARQARIEAGQASDTAVGNADRRMTGHN